MISVWPNRSVWPITDLVYLFSFCAQSTGNFEMRNTNIISSIANGFIRFDAAVNEALRGFSPSYLCLQQPCAGSPARLAYSTLSLSTGDAGTANQSRLQRNDSMSRSTQMMPTTTPRTVVTLSGLKPKQVTGTNWNPRLERRDDLGQR